jgi:uroporphyrinogen decarboxylase
MTRPGIRASGNPLGLPAARWDSRFLRACRGEGVDRAPVWLLRQAGRYMAHYRERRAGGGFLDLCRDPGRSAEVALFAREWLGVDAAILFSDILVVLAALGMPLDYREHDGPQLARPRTGLASVRALRDAQDAAADLGYVEDALRRTVAGLPADIPCIGFTGAPFTLAAYAIEGAGSRQFAKAKAFMYREGAGWDALMARLVDTIALHLAAQVAAGAAALQLFDSWAGHLTLADHREFVLPHLQRLIARLPAGVPVILYTGGGAHLLPNLVHAGADVLACDPGTDLAHAARLVAASGRPQALQGNLDPCLLFAPPERLRAGADAVLAAAAAADGHIFNLGQGILKETDPEQARLLVRHVQSARREPRAGVHGV